MPANYIDESEEILLKYIYILWCIGDWSSLEDYADAKKDNKYADEMLIYKAMSLIQKGDFDAAKEVQSSFVRNRNKIAELMISNIYISLSNAWFIIGDNEKSNSLMRSAVNLTESEVSQERISHLRIDGQKKYLALECSEDNSKGRPIKCTIDILNQVDLGLAWAGNSVNTVIFRHHGILTHNDFQYTSFYVNHETIRIIKRDLNKNELTSFDLKGEYNIRDAHNSISLGIDRERHLHISYDHHGTQLKSRRSLMPECIDVWTDERAMTGLREDKVTYPTFILPTNNSPLQLMYRDGTHQKGSVYLKQFSETENRWIDIGPALLSGAESQPWTSSAYWNHPVCDSEGNLHLSFVWRTHSVGDQLINNMNICYAQSFDGGKNWYSSNIKRFRLPITQVNAEIIWPTSPASNLINQTSMAVDSKNRPHIVFYSNDQRGIPQYQHLWFNGRQWCHQYISERKTRFDLRGGGTLRIPISRPDIVIDKEDNVFVIYRGDLTNDQLSVTFLLAPNYQYNLNQSMVIHDQSVGLSEPVIDRERWKQDGILSILMQYNDQPNHDKDHANLKKTISIVDIKFSLSIS